jgi:acyl carrier protein
VELFAVVVEETGVSMTELKSHPKSTFADFGIDSQMSISIICAFQRAMGVELPAAFFTNFPTPADVQNELGTHRLDDLRLVGAKDRSRSRDSTPRNQRHHKQSPICIEERPSQRLFAIVAEALGLDMSAFTPSTTFESLGLDSMLSIKTSAIFQQETGLELPAAFSTEFQTVAAAQKELEGAPELGAVAQSMSAKKQKSAALSTQDEKIESAVSRAVLIQGSSRSTAAPLFLTADGSGTVESYIHLKALCWKVKFKDFEWLKIQTSAKGHLSAYIHPVVLVLFDLYRLRLKHVLIIA